MSTKERHPVNEVEIKRPVAAVCREVSQPVEAECKMAGQPVSAVCKSVVTVQERQLFFHSVKPALVEVPAYQPIRRVHGMVLSPEPVGLQKQNGPVLQHADVVNASELVFDDRQSKRVKDNLTLRELFSEQEG